MIDIEKNEGRKVAWEQDGTAVKFKNGELALDCMAYQKDWPVHLDICTDENGNLVIGTSSGRAYVAQLDIPQRGYVYPEAAPTGEDGEQADCAAPTPVPLDMGAVTLTLWELE